MARDLVNKSARHARWVGIRTPRTSGSVTRVSPAILNSGVGRALTKPYGKAAALTFLVHASICKL